MLSVTIEEISLTFSAVFLSDQPNEILVAHFGILAVVLRIELHIRSFSVIIIDRFNVNSYRL